MKKNISVEPGKCCIHFARPLYILADWVKLFAATRSKRKFNNPVSFDEKRATAEVPHAATAEEACLGRLTRV